MLERDLEFMNLAGQEAFEAYRRKDFPVGAILTIDDKLLGKSNI